MFGDEVARRGAFIVALVDFAAPVWKSARCPAVRDVMILLLFEARSGGEIPETR